MLDWIMDPQRLNVILNLVGILLGGGALAAVLSHWRGLRALDDAKLVDIRKHYADEIKSLRDRDEKRDQAMRDLEKHWREMIKLADARHQECVDEREELRDQMNALKVELEGVKAQLRAQATDRVLLLEERCVKPSEEAPHSLAAAQRMKAGEGK